MNLDEEQSGSLTRRGQDLDFAVPTESVFISVHPWLKLFFDVRVNARVD